MRNSKNKKQGSQTRKTDKDREMSPKGNTRPERSGSKMKEDNEEVSKPYDEDVAAEMSIRGKKK